MASVSVFIFIVLVIKLIVDDCLPAALRFTSHRIASQRIFPADQDTDIYVCMYVGVSVCICMASTMKLSNLLGQAVSVVVCIAKQANLSRSSPAAD